MKHLFFLLLCLTGGLVSAQNAIQFESPIHDFGRIKMNSKAEYSFVFKNTSSSDVSLKKVQASCGCTTPSWTKDPVKPGATGSIVVSYNTSKSGPFNKSITVIYDSTQAPIYLTIKGEVMFDSTMPPSINYQFTKGTLGLDKLIENLPEITNNDKKEVTFRIRNNGTSTMSIKAPNPSEPEVQVSPQLINLMPGQEAAIKVLVLGDKFKVNGPFTKTIKLSTNDLTEPEKILTINGTFKKILTPEELAMAPNIQFDVLEMDGGTVIEGENVEFKFKFKNTGKTDLLIDYAKAACGCTASVPADKIIKPGQESWITATFNSTGRLGLNTKTVTVGSNDPDNPTITLKFKVNVEKDPFHVGGMMNQPNNK